MNISGSVKKKALLSSDTVMQSGYPFLQRDCWQHVWVSNPCLFVTFSSMNISDPVKKKALLCSTNNRQHSPPRPIFRAWQWQSYPKHNGPIRSRADRSCQVLTSEILFAFPFSESVLAAQCCRNLWGLSIDSAWLASAASSLMAKTTSSSIGSIGVLSFSTMGATNISNSDMQ